MVQRHQSGLLFINFVGFSLYGVISGDSSHVDPSTISLNVSCNDGDLEIR